MLCKYGGALVSQKYVEMETCMVMILFGQYHAMYVVDEVIIKLSIYWHLYFM